MILCGPPQLVPELGQLAADAAGVMRSRLMRPSRRPMSCVCASSVSATCSRPGTGQEPPQDSAAYLSSYGLTEERFARAQAV